MRILITGGAGFIGSTVAEAYIKAGHQVLIVDNLSNGNQKLLPSKAEFIRTSISSTSVESAFQRFKPEVVSHHAAQISVQKSISQPIRDAKNDVLGSLKILDLSAKYKVRKIIFASSAGALKRNKLGALAYPSPYALNKELVEQYLKYYYQKSGLTHTILRYSNVYGFGQSYTKNTGVVGEFIKALKNKSKMTITGDGQQSRDFVYISDVVQANLKVLSEGDNLILPISTNTSTTINKLATIFLTELKKKEIVKKSYALTYLKEGKMGVKSSRINFSHTHKTINWKPLVTIEEGIQEVISKLLTEE